MTAMSAKTELCCCIAHSCIAHHGRCMKLRRFASAAQMVQRVSSEEGARAAAALGAASGTGLAGRPAGAQLGALGDFLLARSAEPSPAGCSVARGAGVARRPAGAQVGALARFSVPCPPLALAEGSTKAQQARWGLCCTVQGVLKRNGCKPQMCKPGTYLPDTACWHVGAAYSKSGSISVLAYCSVPLLSAGADQSWAALLTLGFGMACMRPGTP